MIFYIFNLTLNCCVIFIYYFIGVLLGTLITSFLSETGSLPFQSTIIGSLQGLAAGTILYVTFFEVLNNHKHHHHHGRTHQSKSGLPKLIFIASGFVFMVVLELIGWFCYFFRIRSFYFITNLY